jgi:hypothetical protein
MGRWRDKTWSGEAQRCAQKGRSNKNRTHSC